MKYYLKETVSVLIRKFTVSVCGPSRSLEQTIRLLQNAYVFNLENKLYLKKRK